MSVNLTSREEIEEVMSVEGVDNHLEDFPSLLSHPIMDRIIRQASERCLLFLRTHYSEDSLSENVWVREQATYVACYLLSIRRGNPSLYSDLYAQAMEYLEMVRDGLLDPGIPSKSRVAVQTPMLDSRFLETKRLNPMASTRILPGQKVPRFPFNNS